MIGLLRHGSKLATALLMAGTIATPAFAETGTEAKLARADFKTGTSQTFLYGEVSEPDQLGKAYLVFEKAGHQVVGAFYQPRSSFDCFTGTLENDRLALNVEETYTGQQFNYSVALNPATAIAATGNVGDLPLQLQGFEPLSEISANDQRILSTCKAAAFN